MCYGGCNCKRCMGEDDKMSEKKWVQHISGQGEKWEVKPSAYNDMGYSDICVINYHDPKGIARYHFIPKSEYVPCDPPKEWKNVTEEYFTNGFVIGQSSSPEKYTGLKNRDKIRKVRLFKNNGSLATFTDYHPTEAFIVEREKS